MVFFFLFLLKGSLPESPRRSRRTRTQSESNSSAVDSHFSGVALRLEDHCNSRSRTPSGERRGSHSLNAVNAFHLMDGRGSHASHQRDTVHMVARENYVNSELAVLDGEANRFQNARSSDLNSTVTGRNCSPDCRQGGELVSPCPRHGHSGPPPPPPKKNKPRISLLKPKSPNTVLDCHSNRDACRCSTSTLNNTETPAELTLRSASHEQLHGTASCLDVVIAPGDDALYDSHVSCALTSDSLLFNRGTREPVRHNLYSDEDWVSAGGQSSHSNTNCAGAEIQPEHTASVEMRLQPGPSSHVQSADVETGEQSNFALEQGGLASCGAQLVVTSKTVDLRSSSLLVGGSLPLVCSAAAPGHRSLSPPPGDCETAALANTCVVQSVSNGVTRMIAAEESVQHLQPMIVVAPVCLWSSVHSVENAGNMGGNLASGEEHAMTGEWLQE